MNRRAFFSALAAGIATAQMDPDRLLWVPGRKLISIPAEAPRLLAPDLTLTTSAFRTFRVGDVISVCLSRAEGSQLYRVFKAEGSTSVCRAVGWSAERPTIRIDA
jgi:hypothetical protein